MTEPSPTSRPDPTAAPGATDAAGDGVQLSGTRAAQGRTGRPVLVVLICSVALVVVALFGIWALHAPGLAQGGASGGQSGAGAQGRRFDTPPPSPKQSPPGTPSTEPGALQQPGRS